MGTSTRRAREYRERMRLRGYRPVQAWAPDVRSAAFAAEALAGRRIRTQSSHPHDPRRPLSSRAIRRTASHQWSVSVATLTRTHPGITCSVFNRNR
ncbi:MAG: DUF3018 family protein, partial [Mycobacteriaceae bacterium]|nr:DUF3018 family protein [Mycobacteriaceae bacterium]